MGKSCYLFSLYAPYQESEYASASYNMELTASLLVMRSTSKRRVKIAETWNLSDW